MSGPAISHDSNAQVGTTSRLPANPSLSLGTPLRLSPSTRALIQASVSENTKTAYNHQLVQLEAWLDGQALTDNMLADYLADRFADGLAPASIALVLSAIRFAYNLADLRPPIGSLTMSALKGIRRKGIGLGRGQVSGISFYETKFLAAQIAQEGVKGVRDAAMFCLMSDCMLRVSELVAVRRCHITEMEDGSGRLYIPKSKTDQEGKGQPFLLVLQRLGDSRTGRGWSRVSWGRLMRDSRYSLRCGGVGES